MPSLGTHFGHEPEHLMGTCRCVDLYQVGTTQFTMYVGTVLLLMSALTSLVHVPNCKDGTASAILTLLEQLLSCLPDSFTIPILANVPLVVRSLALSGSLVAGLLHAAGVLGEWIQWPGPRLDVGDVPVATFMFFVMRKCRATPACFALCRRLLHLLSQQLELAMPTHLVSVLPKQPLPKEGINDRHYPHASCSESQCYEVWVWEAPGSRCPRVHLRLGCSPTVPGSSRTGCEGSVDSFYRSADLGTCIQGSGQNHVIVQ
jgi:hypothetical protein